MTSRISHTSFDAINAYAQSLFWSQVLDFVEDPGDPNEPEPEECLITSRDRGQLLRFITVPDGKKVEEPGASRPAPGGPDPGAGGRADPGAGRVAAGRSPAARWQRLDHARRSRGQRVLHPVQGPAGTGATT
jgi:hypothetical protein